MSHDDASRDMDIDDASRDMPIDDASRDMPIDGTPIYMDIDHDMSIIYDQRTSDRQRQDYFFVTASRILKISKEDISNKTGIPIPEPGSNGVGLDEIDNALRILNLQHHCRGRGPGRVPTHRASGPVELKSLVPTESGVVYRRKDQTGHVIIDQYV